MPEQSARHRRPAVREQSRRHRVRFASVRARASATSSARPERHSKRRRARSGQDHPVVAGPGGSLADALVVQPRCRRKCARALHRERRRCGNDREHTDSSAARRWTRNGTCRRGSSQCACRRHSGRSPDCRRPAAGAAPSGSPAPPTSTTAPAAAPAAGGQAAAPAPAGGRGRGNATGHTPAYWLKITASADGSFTITNPRNGFSKTYAK